MPLPIVPSGQGLIELRLFTFIPMDYIQDPIGVTYQADGEGFSYVRTEYRTVHSLLVDPSKVPRHKGPGRVSFARDIPQGFVVNDFRDTGKSVSYLPAIMQPHLFPLVAMSMPRVLHEVDQAIAMASMDWSFLRFTNGAFQITMRASAANPVAFTRRLIVPTIDYTVEFFFRADGSASVTGFTMAFPRTTSTTSSVSSIATIRSQQAKAQGRCSE